MAAPDKKWRECTMKVLLINGSPHKNGCTYTALAEVAAELEKNGVETEIFHIGAKPVGGCVACWACKQLGKCAFDDTVNEALPKLAEADGVVFGSPVYYACANGSMLGFMQRLSIAGGQHLQFKPAAIVASARRAGTTATLDALAKIPAYHNMPLVSGCYWPMVHGANGKAEDAAQDTEGLQTMRAIGRNMAWMLKCIAAGKAAGIEQPVAEPKQFTSFIR